MRAFERSAILVASGITLLTTALMLDTWRAGRFHVGWSLLGSAVLVGLGLVGLLVAAFRTPAEPSRRDSRPALVIAALLALVIGQFAGFAVLASKGYSSVVGQFVRIRQQQPFGPAQFDRGPDGAIHMTLTHGSGVAVERTMYPLDLSPSAEHIAAAAHLVRISREAATQFSDFETARTILGFSVESAALEGDDDPSVEHLVNPHNMMDDKLLDPNYPESLVFRFLPTGEKQLVAIMYMTRPGQHGPQVGGPLTRWHWHPTAPGCMDEFGVVRARKVNDRCAAGLSGGPTSEMIHVWLVEHSMGVFSHLMGASGVGGAGAAGGHEGHH